MQRIGSVLQGQRSKMTGELFEKMIDAACRYYKEKGIAVIEKTPEPMKVLSQMDQRGQFKACFTKQAQPDYKGAQRGGKTVVFEAKHTDADRIAYSRLTETQIENMYAYEAMGAECFVLVSFMLQDFYRIPWSVWKNMKNLYGRKYLLQSDLEKFRVKVAGYDIHTQGNILHFLDGIDGGTEDDR